MIHIEFSTKAGCYYFQSSFSTFNVSVKETTQVLRKRQMQKL